MIFPWFWSKFDGFSPIFGFGTIFRALSQENETETKKSVSIGSKGWLGGVDSAGLWFMLTGHKKLIRVSESCKNPEFSIFPRIFDDFPWFWSKFDVFSPIFGFGMIFRAFSQENKTETQKSISIGSKG